MSGKQVGVLGASLGWFAGAAMAGGTTEAVHAILALPANPEYGAYLSGECVTCHKPGGPEPGVPAIAGRPAVDIVTGLYEYRSKQRPHTGMQAVAGRLGDAEIAALAAYFSTQP